MKYTAALLGTLLSILGSILALSSSLMAADLSSTPPMVGWIEKVRLSPEGVSIDAKLDTGADTTALNASELEEFVRAGKNWVRFKVIARDGKLVTFERAVRRMISIKRQSGKPDRRPVVRINLCLAGQRMETDVNLVNRDNFEQQMLIGRNFLAGNVTIDPARSFAATAPCEDSQPR